MANARSVMLPGKSEVVLDPERRSLDVEEFERRFLSEIVGQDEAVQSLVNIYQTWNAGMITSERPLGNLLFLGPTGSGKTRVVEVAAEILFGNPDAFVKIDCAEFQHSHEISKLIGSPPGYIGHRESQPLLRQTKIDEYRTERHRITFVMFDEIEKASDALWQLLLGILDKATLTLGDNTKVDFSRCVIVMTSNLGAVEIAKVHTGGIGFRTPNTLASENSGSIDQKIYRVATEAAKRRFSPEFINRIDKMVVFGSLANEHLAKILDIELNKLQSRITATQVDRLFILDYTEAAKQLLLREGTDLKYGARPLKRAIERFVTYPLSNLIATNQIILGDVISVKVDPGGRKLLFSKQSSCPGNFSNQEQIHSSAKEKVLFERVSAANTNKPSVQTEAGSIKNGTWMKEFICFDGSSVQVDTRKEEVGGLKKGMRVKSRSREDKAKPREDMVKEFLQAKLLEIVGFTTANVVVIQADNKFCGTIQIGVFSNFFQVI